MPRTKKAATKHKLTLTLDAETIAALADSAKADFRTPAQQAESLIMTYFGTNQVGLINILDAVYIE